MHRQELTGLIRSKRSYLCVGLDADPARIPSHLKQSSDDPVFEFNRRIIDATMDYAVAYKPNTAFYEAMGHVGWKSLERTMAYLHSHPRGRVFTIADAKRGDIAHTSEQYARAFFDQLGFDAITLSPYLGRDSLDPFLSREGKWAVVLALTSNPGSADLQQWQANPCGGSAKEEATKEEASPSTEPQCLYERVIALFSQWGTDQNTMFVVGATHGRQTEEIRKLLPGHFFLVPGVGAQGGSLEEVSRALLTPGGGVLLNVSRSILYADQGKDFDVRAAAVAAGYQRIMEDLMKEKNLI